MYLLKMFAISLLLTLIIETTIALLWGIRSRKQILLVLLANILTNPAAVLLCWLGVPQLPVELAVVLTEALVYKEPAWKIHRPVLLAIVCNVVSWGTGILIQMMGG
ncbi:MAG: hypothetical protein IKJ99_06335 [Oscillospiraceae bacterium]|nr:hypothetical protein [Oscillospiraceae bacterium]